MNWLWSRRRRNVYPVSATSKMSEIDAAAPPSRGPKRKSSLAFGTTFHPAANVGWNLLIKRIYGAGRRGQIEVVLSIS